MLSNVQSYSLNGHELACLVQGEGVPLVLVHGSLCDYRYWQWQLRGLGERYRLLAPSLRHYYPQRWNGEGADFTTGQHVEELLALIDMQGEPVHLLGHSRGGNICLRLALEAPGRLRSLVLCDPGGDFAADLFLAAGVPVPAAPAERNRFREQALQLIRQGEVEAGLELFVDTVSGPGIWRRSSRHFRDMATDNAMTLIGQVADRPEPLGRARLATLAVPTLLLRGELSPEPFPQVVEALARTLPDVHGQVIAGASHGMNATRPAAFNRAVLEFIDAH
ncbi:pimeloyl-ACP methyl ester carboxylesterase [Pseudomonas citronellolis]|uniref:alpha/beta fold hydrolase n=1 Tax=Pseudomonas citronellolis TaxID=53408 RepID=UPI00209D7ABB|nr:alpha/beta hydrolase [Pseudomonas citronellolis]MCP1644844.1 pimeloyl-ACP methyl ester carboxylesterase [Pseudomonas citronellolis]MCP1667788.1 pimeloyl-ACP methyl ester carboxylesterase [Pseudomonas citronellolis]MCP1699115.1 pimeloyl-ACP methyl ester carboxylesterase [Pseudomonas citronellolis]MCP1704896.1 pimeloyl-ACP methyl ester carboxylesterase [Pseudomonas citronellolis]MCP1799679.1 pimeloyl-ACP methyl ester carboxylesterase [Pseudomonas citronellolis]